MFDDLDIICKGINPLPIGPSLKILWKRKIKQDCKLFSLQDKLAIATSKSVECFNLYTNEPIWDFNHKNLDEAFFASGLFLFYDENSNYFAYQEETNQITPLKEFDSFLFPVGTYKNYLLDDQVLDLTTLEVLDDVPVEEWDGSIGQFLIRKTTDDNVAVFDLETKKVENRKVSIKGRMHIICLPTADTKIIIDRHEQGLTAYNFSDFKPLWDFEDDHIIGQHIISDKYVGFSKDNETRYCLLNKETGEKGFDEHVFGHKFLTGDKYLWSYSEDNKYFVCHNVELSECVNQIEKACSGDVIVKVVNNCLLIESNNGKELICYQGTL